jgi:hypothetical protein
MQQKIDWKPILVSAGKKIGLLAICVVIAILIQPLVKWKPYGGYVHAALNLFFMLFIVGKIF